MKIYLDLIWLINFLFDLILLFSVGIILRRNTSLKKIVLGALAGSLTIFVLFIEISSFTLFIIKIIISILMVLITFGYRDIRYIGRNLVYLYITSSVLGGSLYILNNQFSYQNVGLVFYHNKMSPSIIFLFIIAPLIIYIYTKKLKLLRTNYSKYYNISIYFKDGTKKEITGFVDTGNNLYDPYKRRPIILLNKKEVNFDYTSNNILLVPYETVNKHSLMKCIIPDKVYILGVGFKKNVLVGLIDEKIKIDGADCILHPKLLEEIWENL